MTGSNRYNLMVAGMTGGNTLIDKSSFLEIMFHDFFLPMSLIQLEKLKQRAALLPRDLQMNPQLKKPQGKP